MAKARVRAFSFMGSLNDFLEQIEAFVTGGERAQATVDRLMKAKPPAAQARGVFVELPRELVERIKKIAAALNARGGRPVTALDVLVMMTATAERALRTRKRPAQQRAPKSSV